MGCCASRKTTAVGTSDDIPYKAQNGHHVTENTGTTANGQISTSTNTISDKNGDNGEYQNPSFTITPKYTAGVNTVLPSQSHDRPSESSLKPSSQVFPSTTGYQHTMSTDFLTPGQTTDVLSSSYTNTDHLRASPYLSGMGNRKQYDRTKLDSESFRGFDAPVTHTDSEDGFDSDIEKEEKTPEKFDPRPPSPAEVSLSSLLNEDVAKPEPIKPKRDEQVLKLANTRSDSDPEQTVEIRETLDGVAREPTEIVSHTSIPGAVELQSSSVPEAVERLGTPSTATTRLITPMTQRRTPVVSRSGSPRPRSPQDPIMETLEDAFFRFARYGEVNSEGREMNNKNWAKLCRDCDFVDNKAILTGDVDVIFSRHKPKGQRLIGFDMFVKCLEEVAARKHKSITDQKERRRKVFESVIGKAPEYVGITGISKTGNVERMTDHFLYPATHKIRFDEEGRGLGVDEMMSYDTSEHGYVQGYRDKDTYNLKVGRPSSRSSIRPVSREASNISRSSPKPTRRGPH